MAVMLTKHAEVIRGRQPMHTNPSYGGAFAIGVMLGHRHALPVGHRYRPTVSLNKIAATNYRAPKGRV